MQSETHSPEFEVSPCLLSAADLVSESDVRNLTRGDSPWLSAGNFNTKKPAVTDKGFTFVELMIVVAIISILAGVGMPAYFNYLSRSRQSEVIGEMMAIKASQERFFAENGAYSGNMNGLDQYAVAGTIGDWSSGGFYLYRITANTSTNINAGIIRAEGDLNNDGTLSDCWEVAIEDILAKPAPVVAGGACAGDEGFSFSFLGGLLD